MVYVYMYVYFCLRIYSTIRGYDEFKCIHLYVYDMLYFISEGHVYDICMYVCMYYHLMKACI